MRDVTVLERIADGLTIPHGHLRLGNADRQDHAYPESEGGHDPEVDEEMRRRALITATSLAALGQVLQNMGGELAELALPQTDDAPLPSRLGMVHVHVGQAVTQQLRDVARQSGGQAGLFAAAARYYTTWLSAPSSDVVQGRLGATLAELHTEAGFWCYDSGVDGAGRFTRALQLADRAGDGFEIANAAFHSGRTLVRNGHPDDALKAFQLGRFVLDGFQPGKATPATVRPDDPRLPALTARLHRSSAISYALMGSPEQANLHLAKAHDGWAPQDAYNRGGIDLANAAVLLDLRRLDAAHQLAAHAVRAYGDGYGRNRTSAELMLAEVYVRAGEPRGLVLARQAIGAVSASQSVAVRRERLAPLALALEARPGSDARELARLARGVAAGESPPTA